MADSGRFEQFTGENGVTINIDRVLTVIAAVISTQWWGSIAALIGTAFDEWLIGPLSGLVSFLDSLITAIFNGQAGNIDRAVDDFIDWMSGLPDILGFVVAVLAVVALAYIVVLGRDFSG